MEADGEAEDAEEAGKVVGPHREEREVVGREDGQFFILALDAV